MPDALFCKMRWYTSLEFSDAAGGQDSAVFRMNDIFLPQSSAVTRVLGFNQLSDFYGRWECLGTKIACRMVNNSSTATINCLLLPDIDTTVENLDVSRQYPYAVYKQLGVQSAGTGIKVLRQYMTIRKFEGRRTTDNAYTGTDTASPGSVRFWHLSTEANDATSGYTVNVDVSMTFYVRWYTRKALPDSDIP